MSLNLTINSTGLNGYVDPVAQSFLIERPVFVTKLGVYFSTKDDTLPITLTVRPNEGGSPSSNIISGSITSLDSANVITSNTASNVTYFNFDSPLFLDTGEYSFVLTADTNKYRVWISEFGQTDVNNGSVITKQPYAGTMFRSQNGYTWEANQLQDIKFELHRAKFTSTSATVDFILDTDLLSGNSKYLISTINNGLKSYSGNNVLKVTAPNHGLINGSSVKISLPGEGFLNNANAIYNNIPVDDITGSTFTVSGATSDFFFVTLSNAALTSNITSGSFGGRALISSMVPYSSFYTKLGQTLPPRTTINTKILTTSSTPGIISFQDITPESTVEFNSERRLLGPLHKNQYLSDGESFVYRVEMSTEDDYVSPMIELPFASATFITNDVNSSSIAVNNAYDLVTIANANTLISISNTAVISFSGANEKANVKTMSPGAYVNIAGFQFNANGTYRIASIEANGNNIVICSDGNTIPSANAESTGRAITLTYYPNYVAEEAVSGSSSKAKYFTRTIDLETPSTALVLRLAASTPGNSSVEVYYKIRNYGETTSFTTKEFTRLSLGTMKSTLPDQFVDYEKLIDDLPEFTGIIVKIVLKSSDISVVPKVKDLRIIALE